MTAQASPNRNTLNQRASRARRKDYIGDLERRLHAYEAQGIQVTAEVQAAARKVADENSALREEVRLLRESCAIMKGRIEALAGGAEGRRSGLERTDVGRRRKAGASLEQRKACGRRSLAYQRQTEAIEPADFNEPTAQIRTGNSLPPAHLLHPHSVDTNDTEYNAPNTDSHTSLWYAGSPSTPSLVNDTPIPSYPSPPSPSSTPPNSTPCLQAALIIASWRGVPSDTNIIETHILPELGCAGPARTADCVSPMGCTTYDSMEDFRRGGTCGGETKNAFPDCAVDNGRLFGILAQEG